MVRSLLLIQVIGLTFWGCSFNSETEANELYVRASISLKAAINEMEDYTKSFELYSRARTDIEQILSEFKSSKVATSLSSDLIKVSGYSLNEFQAVRIPLETLANAEHSPSAAARAIKNIDGLKQPTFIINNKSGEIDYSSYRSLVEMAYPNLDVPDKKEHSKKPHEPTTSWDSTYIKDLANSVQSEIYIDSNDFENALALIYLMKDAKIRTEEFIYISDAYFEIGQLKDASLMLIHAFESAKSITDARMRTEAFISIARIHIKADNKTESLKIINKALETVRLITNAASRSSRIVEIVRIYAEAGDFDQALKVSELIQFNPHLNITFAELAGVYAEAHSFNEAHEMIDNINILLIKDAALANIASKYADARRFEEALSIVLGIDDLYLKAISLSAIAREYNEANLNPSEKDKAIMQEIVHTVFPIEKFWE